MWTNVFCLSPLAWMSVYKQVTYLLTHLHSSLRLQSLFVATTFLNKIRFPSSSWMNRIHQVDRNWISESHCEHFSRLSTHYVTGISIIFKRYNTAYIFSDERSYVKVFEKILHIDGIHQSFTGNVGSSVLILNKLEYKNMVNVTDRI